MSEDVPAHLEPSFEHVMTLDVEVEDPIDIGETGDGLRRIIPITGGDISGRVSGHVLPGGADYQLFRVDRPTELVANYAFETDDGARVYVQNRGIRHADPETKRKLRDGEEVDPQDIYFYSVPEFETADPDLAWLSESIFVATGERRPYGVTIVVYRLV